MPTYREPDPLGSVDVPADAYWGVHTARALSNFRVSNRPIGEFPDPIRAYARRKLASARSNVETLNASAAAGRGQNLAAVFEAREATAKLTLPYRSRWGTHA